MEHAINSDGEAAIFVEELAAVPVRGHCAGGRFVLSWVGGSREAVVAPEFEQAACTSGRVLVVEMTGPQIVRETWIQCGRQACE